MRFTEHLDTGLYDLLQRGIFPFIKCNVWSVSQFEILWTFIVIFRRVRKPVVDDQLSASAFPSVRSAFQWQDFRET